jgi:hypothetical protein
MKWNNIEQNETLKINKVSHRENKKTAEITSLNDAQ